MSEETTSNTFTYIPKFVKQTSDMEYGSVVTHENYNEKLNLNTEQGDYNTEVLRLLLTVSESTETYHIPYLDKAITKNYGDLYLQYYDLKDTVESNKTEVDDTISDLKTDVSDATASVEAILNGTKSVGLADKATAIAGIESAAAHTYYGTDYDGVVGFHEVPDSIYVEDASEGTVDTSGIYIQPRINSVDESMLTETVRTKLNKTTISSYNDLLNKPSINSVELSGNKTLSDLGIQPAGNYLTEVPEEYITQTELETALESYSTSEVIADTYVDNITFSTLDSSVTDIKDNLLPAYPKVYIGSVPEGVTPKTGDILAIV